MIWYVLKSLDVDQHLILFLFLQRSPLKTVHWSQDNSSNRGDEDLDNSNNALNVNIDEKSNFDEISIKVDIKQSPTKSMSPRKKRRASATTQMLEKELKAESNRRNSINMANMVGENSNLTLMAASLRRQNEDLKAKLAEAIKIGGSKRKSENLNSIDKLLFEQKENECDDLKKTVSNLEKLLDHVRAHHMLLRILNNFEKISGIHEIFQKNERTNSFLILRRIRSFVFLEESEYTKKF